MNILVVGGAGYIGSHVVLELLKSNHNIIVFDNLSTGSEKNLFKENKFIKGDILSNEDLDKAFLNNKIDAVIHLAALKAAGESMIYIEKYSTNNITGTINLLNALAKYNVNKFIFSSSASVYGTPKYLPMDENHPENPESYYGFTKYTIEKILEWYDKIKNIKFISLRYFNAAGYDLDRKITELEKNPANLIPVVMEAVIKTREKLLIFGNDYETGDGTCYRDYIHVSDLAKAHSDSINFLEKEKKSYKLNLGTGKSYSVLEIVNKAKEITGIDFKVEFTQRRPGDPAISYAESKKAKKILGWSATKSDLDTIISSTWALYKKI